MFKNISLLGGMIYMLSGAVQKKGNNEGFRSCFLAQVVMFDIIWSRGFSFSFFLSFFFFFFWNEEKYKCLGCTAAGSQWLNVEVHHFRPAWITLPMRLQAVGSRRKDLLLGHPGDLLWGFMLSSRYVLLCGKGKPCVLLPSAEVLPSAFWLEI